MTPAEIATMLEGRPTGPGEWTARCPAHEDRKASLGIGTGDDGRALLTCRAHCDTKAVVAAMGLTMADLMPPREEPRRAKSTPAKTHQTPDAAVSWMGKHAGRWVYADATGKPVAVAFRFNKPDGSKDFRPVSLNCSGWYMGAPPAPRPLYRLPELLATTGIVYVVEGEKAADAGAEIGLTTTTSMSGSKAANKSDWNPLAGRDVIILPDNDDAGRKYAADVRQIIEALTPPARVKVVALPGLAEKGDLFDYIEARREDGKDAAEIVASIEAVADATTDTKDESAPPFYKFEPIDSRTFAIADYRPKWAVKGVLVCDQPAILGGPKKSLKTSCLTDLVLSLGSQTDFLGKFPVERKFRVAFISGESGQHTIQETAFRVCHAKGINLAEQDVFWDFRLPQLAVDMELHSLSKGLQERGIEIVVIDPLYLCLLGGDTQGRQASNLFDMGPLLIRVAHACLSIGCTPVLAHHARKNIANAYEPLELEDLSFAGIQEFARQWILVNRRAPFEPGSGLHSLWLSAGGSIGHACLWGLDIDEGRLDDQFRGRIWEVAVKPHQEVRQERVETVEGMKEAREQEKRERKEKAEDAKLLTALDALDPEREGFGANKVCLKTGMSAARFAAAVIRLADERIVEELLIDGTIGSGAKRKIKAVRRLTLDHSDHSDHSD